MSTISKSFAKDCLSASFTSFQEDSCPICEKKFSENDDLNILGIISHDGKHPTHASCLTRWIPYISSCPVVSCKEKFDRATNFEIHKYNASKQKISFKQIVHIWAYIRQDIINSYCTSS